MNLLQTGAAWLGIQLKAAAGVSITYARGVAQVSLTATVAQHEYETIDEKFGLMTSIRMDDWTMTAADLVIGSTITPRKGDVITSPNGVYEVLPVGTLPCYEWLDTSGLLLLIHTKRVG